jgi:hypothetical protein
MKENPADQIRRVSPRSQPAVFIVITARLCRISEFGKKLMTPESAILVLPASIAGAVLGIMVMRAREQGRAELAIWRGAVLIVGSLAAASSLMFFERAFGPWSAAFAALVVVVATSWTALLQALFRLPQPGRAPIRPGELKLLRSPWSGVPEFGAFLRRTPLRRLGGSVFLERHNAGIVLEALRENESTHTWAVLMSIPWLGILALNGLWLAAAAGLAVHLPLNIYPILHVRLARARIEKVGRRAPQPAASVAG